MNARHRARRPDPGFTLLEILISLMILILSLVSIFALFGAASASHRRAVASQNAAQLAWTVLAELEQFPRPAQLPNLAGQKHPAFDGYTYDVNFKRFGPNEIEAEVVVHWKRGGHDETETYRTILLDR
ncbi:MAG: prepilin-type N-terminal cleavage/methylation domain-containing protein [Planctomycetes bacterium]|nr:prepilin-type N-terminal cleavage/methylation domain-containing protein [Planctomycetota bacterium]